MKRLVLLVFGLISFYSGVNGQVLRYTVIERSKDPGYLEMSVKTFSLKDKKHAVSLAIIVRDSANLNKKIICKGVTGEYVRMRFSLNKAYLLEFTSENCYSKKLVLTTKNMPEADLPYIFTYNTNIELLPIIENNTPYPLFLDVPVAVIRYNYKEQFFDYDNTSIKFDTTAYNTLKQGILLKLQESKAH
jgi:hypothetical protein